MILSFYLEHSSYGQSINSKNQKIGCGIYLEGERHQNIGAENLCRHQLDFSVFNDLCKCCLPQCGEEKGASPSVCGEVTTLMTTDWVVERFPWNSFSQQFN